MTVKELKGELEKFPDNYIIYCPGDYCDSIVKATTVKEYQPYNNPDDTKGIILEEF